MPAMEAIKGFKYKRHAKALKTSEFSYADVVTPGAKEPRASKKRVNKKNVAERRQTVQSIDNPRHDPNAKTRPSKRRSAAAASSDVVDKKKTRHSKKNQKKKQSKKQKEEKLVAPMYPTDVISGTSIRERVNASTEADKLFALFQEVLRSETSILAKNFTGKFQFVMNAVKGVSREFLQTLQEENSSQKENNNNIAKNSRNVALAEKKANLQGIITSLQKEERDWVAAKERIEREAQEEIQSPVERPIATSSSAEVDSVQDVMVQSVQHISVQLDTLQKSLVASRFLSDSTMDSKDKLSEHFASYTQQQNGSTDSPRKIIKNLLRGPTPILA